MESSSKSCTLPTADCPNVVSEVFLSGSEPQGGNASLVQCVGGHLQRDVRGTLAPAADRREHGVEKKGEKKDRHEQQECAGLVMEGEHDAEGGVETVYAIGDVEPLSWDWRALRPGHPAQLTDPDGDGIYTLTLPVEAQYTRPLAAEGLAIWTREADLSAFPQLTSPQVLPDALYRMSLEELTQLVREDGALSAGAKWPGVWTRDVAYSSVLALAIVVPDAVRRSLMAKVDSAGRIIQDTGTGGSWPVSTDRMTWALAAWELYAVTGDREWLRTAYDVISRSAEADLHAAFDPATGLVLGETSFMDWREQSYPRWMDPRDIAMSSGTSTNIVHWATYGILADMARALGEPSERWTQTRSDLGRAIATHLHPQDGPGLPAVFRYGRLFPALSPRYDALAHSLALIYGRTVADSDVVTPAVAKRVELPPISLRLCSFSRRACSSSRFEVGVVTVADPQV